jgi:predicted Zn-dependent peptidase
MAVTSDQIQAAAKKYLTSERRDLMVIDVGQPGGAKK